MFLEHQHIRMISEESCDTENWINDINPKNILQKKTFTLNCNNIPQYY